MYLYGERAQTAGANRDRALCFDSRKSSKTATEAPEISRVDAVKVGGGWWVVLRCSRERRTRKEMQPIMGMQAAASDVQGVQRGGGVHGGGVGVR